MSDNSARWLHEAIADGNLGEPFAKMKDSAKDFMFSMLEYMVSHHDIYENELRRVQEVLDKANNKACDCMYCDNGRCVGQKCMPECTPYTGYCPFAEKDE